MPQPLFTPGKDSVPTVQEAGWAPGPVWTGAEYLAPSGFDLQTVQPVASRYTGYADRPTQTRVPEINSCNFTPRRISSNLSFYLVRIGPSQGNYTSRLVQLTTRLHVAPTLRMRGTVPPF